VAAAPLPPLNTPFSNARVEERRSGPPGWLIAVGFAVVLAGVLFLLYNYVLPKKTEGAATTSATAAGTPAPVHTGGAAKKAHPLAKYLEIAGVRWTEDAKQKGKVQFVVVNHSAADLPELKMQISVKAGDKSLAEFPFTVTAIGPYESKDFSAAVNTALKEYELPDWQYLKADFDITSQP
jgi:hypothetical protein